MDKKIEVNSEPFEYTLSVIGGKWKKTIMFWLHRCEVLRYGELKRCVSGDI